MKIALACDHRGYKVKEKIKNFLAKKGIEIRDCGTNSEESCDYPDFASKAASAVSKGETERAILVCGSGIGVSILANKFPRVLAGLCYDVTGAEMSRRHNNTNVLCLSADKCDLDKEDKCENVQKSAFTPLGEDNLEKLISVWLETPFEGGRHKRRVDKILEIEKTLQEEKERS